MSNQNFSSCNKGYELINFCEFDKYAVKSYCAIHGVDESLNLGDITQVDETKLKSFNFICGGSPCFPEGTLVLTEYGYIPIEEVIEGDRVLTHNNQYEKVVKTMAHETTSLMGIYPSVSEMIYCTPEHPFYIRKHTRKWNNSKRSYDRVFSDPEFVLAKNISVDDYIGTAINNIEELPKWDGLFYYKNQYQSSLDCQNELSGLFAKEDFWYLVGRYIGDGWVRTDDYKSFIICSHSGETSQITDRLDNLGINYCIINERTVDKVQVVKKEMWVYLRSFGHGAANKHLTRDIINLPVNMLKAFMEGYIDSDGSFTQGRYKISSVSRRLIYEIGQCVAKVYKRPFSIYFNERPKTCVIEGRVVNQKDTYQICWKPGDDKQDHAFYEDGYIWSPVTKIVSELETSELVYNLEVENDHTYVVQNVIAHNCQDFSVAGRQAGSTWVCSDCGHEYNPLTVHFDKRDRCPNCGSENIDKTRSSLLVEWLRIIRANKPDWGIYENVKNIVGKKFKDTFKMFIDELHEYGYNTHYKVLNAKDYGIPQNRERVYLIIIKKELDNGKFEWPEPFDNGIRLKDILEEEVDEKYYVNTPQAQKLIDDLLDSGKLDKEFSNSVRGGGRGSLDRHQWDMVES